MLQYLLDTNICVFVIRQRPAVVLQRFQQYQPDELAISVVTLAELRYGADRSSDPAKNHSALDGFLAALAIVEFDADAADWYGKVRSDLELRGCPIGPAGHIDRGACVAPGRAGRDQQRQRVQPSERAARRGLDDSVNLGIVQGQADSGAMVGRRSSRENVEEAVTRFQQALD